MNVFQEELHKLGIELGLDDEIAKFFVTSVLPDKELKATQKAYYREMLKRFAQIAPPEGPYEEWDAIDFIVSQDEILSRLAQWLPDYDSIKPRLEQISEKDVESFLHKASEILEKEETQVFFDLENWTNWVTEFVSFEIQESEKIFGYPLPVTEQNALLSESFAKAEELIAHYSAMEIGRSEIIIAVIETELIDFIRAQYSQMLSYIVEAALLSILKLDQEVYWSSQSSNLRELAEDRDVPIESWLEEVEKARDVFEREIFNKAREHAKYFPRYDLIDIARIVLQKAINKTQPILDDVEVDIAEKEPAYHLSIAEIPSLVRIVDEMIRGYQTQRIQREARRYGISDSKLTNIVRAKAIEVLCGEAGKKFNDGKHAAYTAVSSVLAKDLDNLVKGIR